MTSAVNSQRFVKHISGFSLATLCSRILGYARDALVVAQFGGGGMADAFYASFRIANLFRRTLGEGALASSFVPVMERERQKGPGQARHFFSALWSGLVLVSGILAVAGILASRPIVLALTYGFTADPEKLHLTVQLTRILFPHLLFVTMAAAYQGALNVARSFFLPALAPITFSLSLISYILLLRLGWLPIHSPRSQILGLAVCAVLGGALQWLLLVPFLSRTGFRPNFCDPRSHPGVKQVLWLMGPSILGLFTDQLDTFVEMILASFLEEGSFTAIYNSSRILQLPLALFGVATANVALPHLSEKLAENNLPEYRQTLGLSYRLVGFVLLPAMVGLMMLGLPIVQTLFQHGKFTPQEGLLTQQALFFGCLGLVAYGSNKITTIAFYSLKDAATPVKIGLLEMALNASLSSVLMGPLRVGGLTLAASLSAWVSTFLLLGLLSRRIGGLGLRNILFSWGKAALACLAMALAIAAGRSYLAGESAWIQASVLIPAAACVYLAAAAGLQMEERKIVISAFRPAR